jgi:hypothetical protein
MGERMARKWSKRKIAAKLAELERKPTSVRRDELIGLLRTVIEEGTPVEKELFAREFLERVLENMPIAERHKFLTDLWKQSLN